ncbi:MAG: hypothetical protein VKJ31_00205 [Synechococcus sp.]|nr:hypothetical protein [Synechococcus sp.]
MSDNQKQESVSDQELQAAAGGAAGPNDVQGLSNSVTGSGNTVKGDNNSINNGVSNVIQGTGNSIG